MRSSANAKRTDDKIRRPPDGCGPFLAGEEMIEPFRRALNDNSTLTEEDFVEKVVIDADADHLHHQKNLIRQLSLGAVREKATRNRCLHRKD